MNTEDLEVNTLRCFGITRGLWLPIPFLFRTAGFSDWGEQEEMAQELKDVGTGRQEAYLSLCSGAT